MTVNASFNSASEFRCAKPEIQTAKFSHRQKHQQPKENVSYPVYQPGNTVNLAGRDTSYNVQQCYSVDTGVMATLHWLLKIKGASSYEFERPLRRLLFPASVRKKNMAKKTA